METDSLSRWSSFLGADASAAATLTGLVFVGISINLTKIISSSSVTKRAAESIVQLMGAFAVSTTLLIPGQSPQADGREVLLIGLVLWITQIIFQMGISPGRMGNSWTRFLVRISLGQLAAVPFVIGGIRLLLGHPSGFYWVAFGLHFCFVAGVIGAWVLLVEIIR